jgi:hypothetical protein
MPGVPPSAAGVPPTIIVHGNDEWAFEPELGAAGAPRAPDVGYIDEARSGEAIREPEGGQR